MGSPAAFKITDENDSTNSSGCVELPGIVSVSGINYSHNSGPILEVGGLSVYKNDSVVKFNVNWWRSPPLADQSFELGFYTDSLCSSSNGNQPAMTTSTSGMDLDLHSTTNSIKINDITDGTGVTRAAPVCIKAVRFPPSQKPVFTRYNAGSRWVGLSWQSADPVELFQFSGPDCMKDKTAVTLDKPFGTQQQNWAGVNKLSPSTKYSFRLTTGVDSSECQNVMTTSGDAPDWTSGNNQEWPSSQNVLLDFASKVTDGKDYKLKVSVNGRVPVDSYSQSIPKADVLTLVKMSSADASGQVLTVWTPSGCSFVDSNGNRFPSLSLPGFPGQKLPNVVCDGAASNDGGGGSESFGGYSTMKLASKGINLKITNGAFTMIEDLYESGNCAVGTRISSRVELGALSLPGPDFLKDTFPIDVTSKEISGVIFTDASVLAAKAEPDRFGCGIKEWVKGQRINLKGSVCGKEVGRTKYERLKVVGDRLYFCEVDGEQDAYGMTPDMRIPSCEINEQSFFLKRQ
jgi:hypothetical protein